MACGVHLGILLICLVQAEHARCLWVTEAQRSRRHNSDRYVGFSQQDSGVQRLGGSYPQNQFRQASVSAGSAHNSSLNVQTADDSGFSQGLSTSDLTFSQPAPDDYASYGLLQSSSGSKANRRVKNWQSVNDQKVPKAQFLNMHPPISSGSAINQNGRFNGKKTWPAQQDTRHPDKYLFGNVMSVQSRPSENHPFASASQPRVHGAFGSSAEQRVRGLGGLSFRPPGADAPAEMQPSACVLGRKVSSHRHPGSLKPFSFPRPQNKRLRKNLAQHDPHQSYQIPVHEENGQQTFGPSSVMASNCVSFHPDWPYAQNAVGSETPKRHGQLSSSSTSMSSGPDSWPNRNPAQGAHNLLASGGSSSKAERLGLHLAPSRTFVIPQHLGGNVIRRPKGKADQQEVSVLKPQQTYAIAPRGPSAQKPKGHWVKWYRVKLVR